jgi:hypothetical protein
MFVARSPEGTDARESYDANPYASPYDHSAARILHSGQRAGAVPGIDPAEAERGDRADTRRGHEPANLRIITCQLHERSDRLRLGIDYALSHH